MGRKARTNCSTFDVAMNKYHSGIGNRLSAAPEHLLADSGENLSQDFSMLTIAKNQSSCIKYRPSPAEAVCVYKDDVRPVKDKDSFKPITITATTLKQSPSSGTAPMCDSTGDKENNRASKRRLFEKLSCVLFPKKHMCSRCKRRSRSCVSNKTFNGSDKRYMCCRCREVPHSIRTIPDGHSCLKDSRLVNSSSRKSLVSHRKDRSIPVTRTYLKDSGYETVTSCSTVASSYSAYSTPANVCKVTDTVKPCLNCDSELLPKKSSSAQKLEHSNIQHEADGRITYTDSHPDISIDAINSAPELRNYLTDDHHKSLLVRQRTVDTYDGFISEADLNDWNQDGTKSVVHDASDLDEDPENGDTFYLAPRIIRVSQTGKNTVGTEKACYTCDSTAKPCFRLPWEGGWICEDCLDGLH